MSFTELARDKSLRPSGFNFNAEFKTYLQRVSPNQTIDCSGFIFSEKIDFKTLIGKSISNPINFSRATFEEEVDFSEVNFNEYTNFSRVTFKGATSFSRATFFKGTTRFYKAIFNELTNFFNANFEKINFSSATFNEYTNFSRATFKGATSFSEATFNELTNFSNVTFEENLLLSDLKGQTGCLKFNSVKFKSMGIIGITKESSPKIEFGNNSLEETGKITLRNCYMSKINVVDDDYENFIFENCKWEKINAGQFPWDLLKVKGNHDPKNIGISPQKQKEIYSSLKKIALNSGDTQLANEFHFWQLYFADREKWNFVRFFYYHSCGFGHDWVRPIFWWFVTGIFFCFFYYCLLTFSFNFLNNFSFINELSSGKCTEIFSSEASKKSIILALEGATFGFDPVKILECSRIPALISCCLLYFFQKSISIFLLYEFGQAIRKYIKI